jgi:hypothetical protein
LPQQDAISAAAPGYRGGSSHSSSEAALLNFNFKWLHRLMQAYGAAAPHYTMMHELLVTILYVMKE